jgi:hypothetical protein
MTSFELEKQKKIEFYNNNNFFLKIHSQLSALNFLFFSPLKSFLPLQKRGGEKKPQKQKQKINQKLKN